MNGGAAVASAAVTPPVRVAPETVAVADVSARVIELPEVPVDLAESVTTSAFDVAVTFASDPNPFPLLIVSAIAAAQVVAFWVGKGATI